MTGRRRQAVLLALAAGLAALPAGALISTSFTPLHLAGHSRTILAGRLEAGTGTNAWQVSGIAAMKGAAPPRLELQAENCKPEQADDLRRLFRQNLRAPALFFAGDPDGTNTSAILHVGGQWLRLARRDGARWDMQAFDAKLSATYAGGTDMLIRMMRHILDDPSAEVPTTVGMNWADGAAVGTVTGAIGGLCAVAWTNRGAPCLFVASAAGDRLFLPRGLPAGGIAWEDVTAAAQLDSRSRQFAWVDLDRDGRPDLVSWDGAGIAARLMRADGTFTRAGASAAPGLGACLGLAPMSVAADGAPGVLASTTNDRPLFLTWQPGAGWRQAELPPPRAAPGGAPAACVVADFDNDGLPEVLQPREVGGLLWRWNAGAFLPPVPSPVSSPGPSGCAALGDFDGDGAVDIFLGGSGRNWLWENDGAGGFREVVGAAGSLGYKALPGAACALAADLNHDGRCDLSLGYPESGVAYHFNRGFRCFGEEGTLRLDEVDGGPRPASFGVRGCAAADCNGDGSEDLAVAFAGGEIAWYENSLSQPPAVRVRLADRRTGPVTVSAWRGTGAVCLATCVLSGSQPARFLNVRTPEPCRLRWSLPGRPGREQTASPSGTNCVVIGE